MARNVKQPVSVKLHPAYLERVKDHRNADSRSHVGSYLFFGDDLTLAYAYDVFAEHGSVHKAFVVPVGWALIVSKD